MRNNMQLAIIPPVNEMTAAALFAAKSMLSIYKEESPASDPTHAQHPPD
jgi:hypothetical protein